MVAIWPITDLLNASAELLSDLYVRMRWRCKKIPGPGAVRKYNDYLRHAAECREMARTVPPGHRAQLEQMADVWEQLAEARKRQLERRGMSVDQDTGEFE
jgi:hypothetical protein